MGKKEANFSSRAIYLIFFSNGKPKQFSYSFRSSSSGSWGLSVGVLSRIDSVISGVSTGDFSSLSAFSCSDTSGVGSDVTECGGLGVATGVAMGLF